MRAHQKTRMLAAGLTVIAVGVALRGQSTNVDGPARDALFEREVEALFPKLVEIRRDLHQHPELSNEEERTGRVIAERLRGLGLEVKTGVARHGVVALLKGGKPGKVVAVRADMDALPIHEAGQTPYRSRALGVHHACGHDVHMTVALGLADLLSRHRDQVEGTVKFLFQPAEESMPASFVGDWGAKLMVKEGAMENPKPEAVFALHCAPWVTPTAGAKAGQDTLFTTGKIGYTIGPSSANSDRFRLLIKGKMAHGSAPQKGVDSIVVAAQAVTALQTIRSRMTDTQQPLVLTIGSIHGGNRENIIADQVEMTGTVRTYDEAFRDRVIELMHRALKGVTEASGASYELDYKTGYPVVMNDEALVKASLPALHRVVGADNVVPVNPGMGGEDFSYFDRVSPGFYFRLGTANEAKGFTAGVHTAEYDSDEDCLKIGVRAMAALVCDFLSRRR